MMRKQKTTFVERLLGGERRPPYQRGRGAAGKLEDLGGGYTKLLSMGGINSMQGENGSRMGRC